MLKSKRVAVLAACSAMVLGLAACGSSDSGSDSGGDSVKVAMVLPGPINDKGFNESGYELTAEHGLVTSEVVSRVSLA